MPRIPRHQSAPGVMCPGTLYHVTSHAVAGTWLFETARDRIVFLSLLAWQCRERGLVVHAFCLMGNHIHLQLEDRRGQLSQAMSLVKSMYARYYNATRPGGRRKGALWAERFSAEVIDSRRYYDAAAAYVLLNPNRVEEPMVDSPEVYPWSSCAMTVGPGVTPAAYFARMVEKEGGVDAILDSMPKARNPASKANRRRRIEILIEGKEFVVDGVLGARSRVEYLEFLRAKVNVAAIEFHEAVAESRERQESNADSADEADLMDQKEMQIRSASSARSARFAMPSAPRFPSPDIPRVLHAFTGLSRSAVVDTILGSLQQWLPVSSERSRELKRVEAWALFRFTGYGTRKIARLLKTTVAKVDEAIRSVRALREKERAWWRVIWNAEWSLRWSLAAAPWRE